MVKTPHTDIWKKRLKESGSKATLGRVALLQAIFEAQKPQSPAQLAKQLGRSLNTATVYRALEALTKQGLLRRIDLGHAHAHYELSETGRHHHHLICKDCGVIEDVEICQPKQIEKDVLRQSKKFSAIASHSLEFFGQCKQCA